MGVGVGWMQEEFAAMSASFRERGNIADEQLEVLDTIWKKDHATFHGQHYGFDDIAFSPKPYQKPRIPIWIGGEGKLAQRRAGRYGDAWFPYFVRITPKELATRFENVRRCAREAGRNPDAITFACCLPLELTPLDIPQEENYLRGSVQQVADAIKKFRDVGVTHMGLQFMIPHYPERREQIERFAKEGLPVLRG
jgi:alkanesulfonate monooxygenase SsuD/methylene tetrahydromethanopterin reductase-like flavin-dependent oxidoreductase (luciferase family)